MLHSKALAVLAITLLATHPDEGQWLPSQVRAMDWDQLRSRGMQLTKDEFWHPEYGGVLNGAIQVGGCSAAMVSADGLAITNHHCGDDAIGKLSTLERNYIKEGFVARSREHELPTDLVMQVVAKIDDVTAQIHAAQARAEGNALRRYEFTQAEIQSLIDQGETDSATGARDPMKTCQVASFFEGREYHRYTRTKITDVRLVYAPPARTADFGGNIDNWEWPRHSGDFMMLRGYTAPDGTPRPYQPENVPYQPDHYLKVATEGIREGDLVLIMGYPGKTDRYLTSVAMQQWQGFRFPKRREIYLGLLEVLQEQAAVSAQRGLELNASINTFLNIEKNHLGQTEGLQRNAVVDRKIREEEAFLEWAKRNNKQDYIATLEQLVALDHQQRTTMEKDLVLRMLKSARVRALVPLFSTMSRLIREAGEATDGGAIDYPAELVDAIGDPNVTAEFEALQKPLLRVLFEEVRNLPQDQWLQGAEVFPDSDVSSAKMIHQLFESSSMLSASARVALLKAGRAAIDASADPLVVLMRGLEREMAAFDTRDRTAAGERMVVGAGWIAAQQAWRGKSFYPDANRTLRVSIAEVQGYSPRDAIYAGPFTTLAGMMDKNTGEEPFKMTDQLHEAARRRWLSRFRDPRLGDVPVCFLANGDTTNGNSGSPVINGKGELVGLNFDRVFENVSCDFGWNAERSRNISLDIRFVLWHLESVMPAPRLLREMGVR